MCRLVSGNAIRLELSQVSESAQRGKGLHDNRRDISRLESCETRRSHDASRGVARCAEKETLQLEELRVVRKDTTELGPRRLSPWPTH